MSSSYELIQKRSRYRTMKENVNKMINVLSSNDIKDDITSVQTSLKSYYTVNDSPIKYSELQKQKERLSSCLASLRTILSSIEYKINCLNNDIEEAEAEEEREALEQETGE